VGERGRLLERLQQRVLALVAKRLGLLDHEGASLALGRAEAGRPDHRLANVVDQVLGAGRPQPDQVRMGAGIEQRPAAGVVGICCALGEELGGEGTGRGPLARPARPAEEIGVAGAGGEGGGEGRLGAGLMASRLGEPGGDPRLALRRGAHARTPLTSAITAAWTESGSPLASITRTRRGLRLATAS
jgi:hypothetical protein